MMNKTPYIDIIPLLAKFKGRVFDLIHLTEEQQCVAYQQAIDLVDRGDTGGRTNDQIINDRLRGLAGEYSFRIFLTEQGLSTYDPIEWWYDFMYAGAHVDHKSKLSGFTYT